MTSIFIDDTRDETPDRGDGTVELLHERLRRESTNTMYYAYRHVDHITFAIIFTVSIGIVSRPTLSTTAMYTVLLFIS